MARAEQDDFAVYLYEWQGNDAELTRYGKDHLKQISKRLDVAPFPVVIERSDDGALDEVRRQSIVAALAAVGYEDADKRVVVGHPDAEPLHGLAAPRIGGGYLGAGGEGGTGIGSGSGGFGAGRGFGAGVGVGSAFGGF